MIWDIVLTIVGSIALYVYIIRPFLLRREIHFVEKKTNEIIDIIFKFPVLDEKSKKNIIYVSDLYKKTDFKNHSDIGLQLYTIQFIHSYVVCILELTISYGSMSNGGESSQDIPSLSKRKAHLELALKNILVYINELDLE